jgi:hypothetical protein
MPDPARIQTVSNLLDRLRASSGSCGDRHSFLNNPDGPAAADEIEQLRAAIAKIWHSQIYEGHKRENGVSVDLVEAIRSAALVAGLRGEDLPLSPTMIAVAEKLKELAARGIYPKLDITLPGNLDALMAM